MVAVAGLPALSTDVPGTESVLEVMSMRRALTVAGAGLIAVAAYERLVQSWQRRWGATDDEVGAILPGDELTAEPVVQSTRAITIAAPPAQVWPWLLQLGADRGGFYSYARLENVFGLRIRNADAIVPGWQHLRVGDMVWADGARTGGWIVERLEPDALLVLKVADVEQRRATRRDEGVGFEFQWTFALRPDPAGSTRLLVRERVGFGRRLTRWLMTPVGMVSFVMTRKMLRGIEQRAERRATIDRSSAT
jgi:hypothetical protein